MHPPGSVGLLGFSLVVALAASQASTAAIAQERPLEQGRLGGGVRVVELEKIPTARDPWTVLPSCSPPAEPAAPVADRLLLSVDDHRPLAALADALEKRYGLILTYEEGPWQAPADLEDVTAAIARENGPGRAPKVSIIGPRKSAVAFEYACDIEIGRPCDTARLLAALLDQHESAGAPGRFRFEGAGGIYHLIPTLVAGGAGGWVAVEPILSTPIRLEDKERSVNDLLDDIVAQLNRASAVKIGWGWAPLNFMVQNEVRLSAHGEPAREVLRRLLASLPRRLTWRLNYDPTTSRYYFNLLLLC